MKGASDFDLFIRAANFAAFKHRDQRRKDSHKSPYINHPLALANVLVGEAGIQDAVVLSAAILHDMIEDTDTTFEKLKTGFGKAMASIVMEVTDDKLLRKPERKRLQILHAGQASRRARLVKLADKICNLRDMVASPPASWDLRRKRKYFDWAKQVVDGMRGTNRKLEKLFDEAYARRP